MATLTETAHTGEFILSLANRNRSLDNITVASGANLQPGTVLGRIDVGDATAAAKAGGNTGNGTFTIDATNPVRPGAKVGVYTVRCITAAANSGTFRVEDPDGNVLGDVAVAATFDDDIKFVIADGANDFIVGDGFDVTIVAGTGKWKALDTTKADGLQNAAGVLYAYAAAASADAKGVAVARDAEVVLASLAWPSGISNGAKAAALAQLRQLGIVAR